MNDVLSRVKAIQAEHGWNFDRTFQYAMSEDNHTGTFGRDPVDKGATLIPIATDGSPTKVGQYPSVARELNKHRALDQKRKATETMNHVRRLAAIRQLMENDPSLSFDAAFTRIIQQESVAAPAKASQTAPKGQGKLMLIQGAHAGFMLDIRTGKRAE
jgi:hypothetical protein